MTVATENLTVSSGVGSWQLFGDYQGVLLAHLEKRGENVNSAS
jgi:hypothetical protein